MSSLVGWIVNSFIFGIFTIIIYFRLQKLDGKLAVVLVFGDLGHSPRTISHARSLLRNGYKVHLVGYHISELSQDIVGNEKCTVHKLPVPTLLGKRGIVLFLFYGVARFISQCFGMLLLFLTIPRPGLLLVQNPPAVPTLLIAQVYTILCGTRLVIDWHNFGFSIIKLQKGGLASIPFKMLHEC